MHFPKNFIDSLRNRILISEVISKEINLIKKNNNFLGLCPFHNEKTPSFTVNDNRGFYHCFGCGEHGDAFDFLMKYNKLSFSDAVAELARIAGLPLPEVTPEERKKAGRQAIYYEILGSVNQFYHKELLKNSQAVAYLRGRGVNNDAIKKYSLGYSSSNHELIKLLLSKYDEEQLLASGVFKKKDGDIYSIFNKRIIFPIFNQMNNVEAFGGRGMTDEQQPKYLNSPETEFFHKRSSLYGINLARSAIEQNIIVTEGYMDVISLYCSGITNVVGVLGTAITHEHMDQLWRMKDEVVFCMDGDQAGRRAMAKAASTALEKLKTRKSAKFVDIGSRLDPDDYIKRFGKSKFLQLIKESANLSEYLWTNFFNHQHSRTPEAKVALESTAKDLASKIEDSKLSSAYLEFFRKKIWSIFNQKKSKKNLTENISIQSIAKIDKLMKYELILAHFIDDDHELLNSPEVQEYILNHEFSTEQTKAIFERIISLFNEDKVIKQEDLEKIKKQIPQEITKEVSVILDKNKINNYKSSTEKWFFVTKLITIEILKNEYSHLIRSMDDSSYEKAAIIKNEISSIEKLIRDELNK